MSALVISLILQLTLGCNYIDPFGNGYAKPSGSCISLDYIPMSYSYSCDSTSSFIYSTYSTAECSGTATIESTTAVSFNCTGYDSQNQLNNCDVVEYENWLYSENCSNDIYVERQSFVINKCLPKTNNYQMVTCDDSTITFTTYDNAKCEVNDNNGILYINHPYGDSYKITKCGDQILDYCHTASSNTGNPTTTSTSISSTVSSILTSIASSNTGNPTAISSTAISSLPTCANSNPCPKETICDDTPTGPICLNIGDKCGSPPDDCPAFRCPCGLCANRKTQFGCCSICVVEDFGKGPKCSGVINQARVCKCGGYGDLCVEYYDGCNTCTCNDGSESCTYIYNCFTAGEPKCTKCIFGYVPDIDGECREIKKCNTYSDCDTMNGFQCRVDPVCRGRGKWGKIEYCDMKNPAYVCVDISGRCASDSDCDEGYVCVGKNNRLFGFCSKYE